VHELTALVARAVLVPGQLWLTNESGVSIPLERGLAHSNMGSPTVVHTCWPSFEHMDCQQQTSPAIPMLSGLLLGYTCIGCGLVA
jgi:hypothetical protein